MKNRIKLALLVPMLAVASLLPALFSASPASASTCDMTGWLTPANNGNYYVPDSSNFVWNFGNLQGAQRGACFIVGLNPGSDPNGWYQIYVKVQDVNDYKINAYDWDDQGSFRIQFIPPGWSNWIESTNPVFWNYGASQFLAADANSVDYEDNDNHGIWASQWFYAPTNGSPSAWQWRPVAQGHGRPTSQNAWGWYDLAPWGTVGKNIIW